MAPEFWYALATVMIVVGLAGTVLPLLPGAPVMWLGMLIVAWVGNFQRVGWISLLILGLLAALTTAMDFLASALGAKGAGASRYAFIGASVGALFGLLLGPLGLIVGPLIGALAGELIASQNVERATRAGVGAAFGYILGSVVKLALAFIMLGVFAIALWGPGSPSGP